MYHLNVQRERESWKERKKWIDMFSSPLSRLQRGQVRKALRIWLPHALSTALKLISSGLGPCCSMPSSKTSNESDETSTKKFWKKNAWHFLPPVNGGSVRMGFLLVNLQKPTGPCQVASACCHPLPWQALSAALHVSSSGSNKAFWAGR